MAADGRARCPGLFIAARRPRAVRRCSPAPRTPHRDTATHIVQLRAGVSLAEGRAAVRAAHGQVAGALPIISGLAVRLPAGARARLAHDAADRAVSANARDPARRADRVDPAAARPTAYPASVLAPPVWNSATGATGAGVGVAVIDTGIDGGLPDFTDAARRLARGRLASSPTRTRRRRTTATATARTSRASSPATAPAAPAGDPLAGSYVGIAPDANLVAIKAADDAGQRDTILDAIYGLQFAVDHKDDYNIRVVNLSLASTVAESYQTDPLDAAVESAYFHGIVVVAAAGNRGTAADARQLLARQRPVRDHGRRGRRPGHHGPRRRHRRRRGRASARRRTASPSPRSPPRARTSSRRSRRGSAFAQLCPSCVVDGDYIRIGGTSMAAPVVAGVAALLLAGPPGLDARPGQVDADRDRPRRPRRHRRGQRRRRDRRSSAPASGANDGLAPNDARRPRHRRHRLHPLELGPLELGRRPGRRWRPTGRARAGAASAPAGRPSGTDESTRSSWGSATWLVKWNG